MRKGEELKAPRYASAAATRDYITARDIIPNIKISYYLITNVIKGVHLYGVERVFTKSNLFP
jgi:hypothetical protein